MEYIHIPKRLVEEARRRGIDIETFVIETLTEKLGIDPREGAEIHLERAETFFREGVELVDKDPVQACEKLYKAAEECVKALAKLLGLEEVLTRVRSRGRWTVTDLERTVRAAVRELGEDVRHGWDSANYLHVWGFHEAKLDAEAVKARIQDIETMLRLVKEFLEKRKQSLS